MKLVRLLSAGTVAAGGALLGLSLALTAGAARADDWIVGDNIFVTSGASVGNHTTYVTGTANDLPFGTTFVDYGKYSGGAFTFEDISSIQNPLFPFAFNVDKVNSYGSFGSTPFAYADPLAKSSWISVAVDPGPNGPGPAPVGTFAGEPLRMGKAFPDTFAYTTVFNVAQSGWYEVGGKFLSDDTLQGVALNYDFTTGARDADLTTTNPADTYRTPGTLAGTFQHLNAGDNLLTFFVSNENNDRTGLSYSATLTLVPEPGAVTFGTMLSCSLLGLMVRARRRSRS
jgi:hypothetical protein